MSVSVVVVGHGDEPLLEACLRSIVDQTGPGDEVVLVDHGITDLPAVPGVAVLTPAKNTGFGGGCSSGVEATTGDVLVFVNSDAVVRPGALAALAGAVADPGVGLAGGLVLLPGEVDIVNSVGLPVHLSGLSWCDGYGEALEARHLRPRRLASVAGALFACRREVWAALGGMDTSYFMYHEDTDLSLRSHLAGLDVVLCPDAVAVHAYEFSRNPRKMYHLERNRLLTVFGDYPGHLLGRVLPVIAVLEPAYFVIALRDGWAREKLRAWWWLLRHAGTVRSRRRRVQAAVTRPHALDSLLSAEVTQTQLEQPASMAAVNSVLHAYWRLARPTTGAGAARPDVAVLRSNPRDSSLARLLTVLVDRYSVLAVVWDRTDDYRCPVESPRLEVVASTRRGEYYRPSTVLTVAGLQPWFLWRTLRGRPRLVHAMDLDTGVAGLIAARLLRVPFVYQCLDPYDASMPQGWPRWIASAVHRVENAVIGAADLFVITDEGRLPQHEGAAPRAVLEFPNVPLAFPPVRPWPEGDLTVAYVGSLIPHRALDILVDTVGALAGQGVSLVIGGFGALEDELRRRSELYPNVSFLGPLTYDRALAVMGEADVVVQLGDPSHPGLRWVSPNKVFESMALARPVIVAEGTLAAERARQAGHGVTVRYGDGADLTAALERLRDDRQRAHALGEAGRRTFENRWSPDRVTSTVETAYARVLEQQVAR